MNRNTLLGMVITHAERDQYLTSREIFKRAFRPFDNLHSVQTIIYKGQKDGLLERETPHQRARLRLTERGAEIRAKLANGP